MINVSNGTEFSAAWWNCSNLTEFPALDMPNGDSFSEAWNGCTSLTSFPHLNLSKGTNFYAAWRYCNNLTNLGGFGAISADIELSYSPKLTVESIMNVITQAADLNELGIAGKTMNFGGTNLNKLTDEQKAVATSKGWTLS